MALFIMVSIPLITRFKGAIATLAAVLNAVLNAVGMFSSNLFHFVGPNCSEIFFHQFENPVWFHHVVKEVHFSESDDSIV